MRRTNSNSEDHTRLTIQILTAIGLVLLVYFLLSIPLFVPEVFSTELLTDTNGNKQHKCFLGAYYYKVASERGSWTGIETTIRLGYPQVDKNRANPKQDGFLDAFNIYLGGNADGEEIDAGLHFEPMRVDCHCPNNTCGSWRPFWRNDRWNMAPNKPEFAWHPGELVKMSVTVVGPGTLRLYVSDIGPNPKRSFQQDFSAPNFGRARSIELKRVNDVAQHGNEGRPVIATKSQVVNAIWEETALLSTNGTKLERTVLTAKNSWNICCPSGGHVVVTQSDAQKAKGGETVSVYGTVPPKK